MEHSIAFSKYHGLGNDYLVIKQSELYGEEIYLLARAVCDRHYGIGSDGLLVGPYPSTSADFGLRIFNPDGSEAEKSGNGLRIFARYLWDCGRVTQSQFSVETIGGVVHCQVSPDTGVVSIQMGRASFISRNILISGMDHETIVDQLIVADETFEICRISMGNPHCVVLNKPAQTELAQRLGPLIERHPSFPKRTNVQFLKVIDRQNIQIEIWERGAGYTLASGSSACASASAAHRLGWCDANISVQMPGGQLQVEIGVNGMITLYGPVQRICSGNYWYEVGNPSVS
jgi:diaminopimelate epimerase